MSAVQRTRYGTQRGTHEILPICTATSTTIRTAKRTKIRTTKGATNARRANRTQQSEGESVGAFPWISHWLPPTNRAGYTPGYTKIGLARRWCTIRLRWPRHPDLNVGRSSPWHISPCVVRTKLGLLRSNENWTESRTTIPAGSGFLCSDADHVEPPEGYSVLLPP